MSSRVDKARAACTTALQQVEEALPKTPPRAATPPSQLIAPLFDRERLMGIRDELQQMLAVLDPEKFLPGFGWYLVDQYEAGNALSDCLSEAVGLYKAIRPQDVDG